MATNTIQTIFHLTEDDFFDNPPFYPPPPIPTRITFPLRQIAGGSPIGGIINEIYSSARVQINEQVTDIELMDFRPRRVEWNRATSTNLPKITIQVEPRERGRTPGGILPPRPESLSRKIHINTLYMLLMSLGGILAAILTLVVLYLEFIHKVFI